MRYILFNHQGKGDAYDKALSLKHERVEDSADFVFSDQAILGRVHKLEKIGADKNFLYPHSGRPNLAADMLPMWGGITAEFVAAEGHRDVMRKCGNNKPIYVVGWSLCEIREFQPRSVKNVLFAPIHPRCDEMDRKLNKHVFDTLRDLDIQLTVRYIGSLEDNGLEHDPNVNWTIGDLRPSTEQIDEADVVVAHQTFAYLAVARGIPTVMFGEDMPMHLVPKDQPPIFAKRWQMYHKLMRYPLDIQDSVPSRMLELATQPNREVEKWKERMIGKPFDENILLQRLEEHL